MEACTVEFNSNGGSAVEGNVYPEGSTIEEPSEPTKSGYKFGGWYTENGELWNFDDEIYGNITLTAKWLEIYTVVFENDDGETILEAEVVEGDTIVAPKSPSKVGYRFDGWVTDSGDEWSFDTAPTESITLTAKWVKVYTVSFNSNGGSEVDSVTVDENSTFDAPSAPELFGYELVGWYTEDGDLWDFDTNVVTEDITLKAEWIRVYKVEIRFNCQESSEPIYVYVREGATVTLPEIPKRSNGQVILYWVKGNAKEVENGVVTNMWSIEEDVVTEEGVVLKAFWGASGVTVLPDGSIITKPDDFTTGNN